VNWLCKSESIDRADKERIRLTLQRGYRLLPVGLQIRSALIGGKSLEFVSASDWIEMAQVCTSSSAVEEQEHSRVGEPDTSHVNHG
jgi:hypothetical protein